MSPQRIELIKLEDLSVDHFNPRHSPQSSQREAITTIARDQGMKLFNLAEDIVDKGLNPSDLPIVTLANADAQTYTVLEGNRRIAALKLLTNPQLLASIGLTRGVVNRYRALADRAGADIPKELNCAIVAPEDAQHWIQLKHTGENEGVGVVGWDGRARQRFRGSSPALQAIELVENSKFIDEDTKKNLEKIAITNIARLLGTPDARKALGVDVVDKQLILLGQEEDALGRLAIVVGAVANREIKVTDLDTKEQRINYAKKVAGMPLPQVDNSGRAGSAGPASAGGAAPTQASGARPIRPQRKTIIPRNFQLRVTQTRLNNIYHELKKLDVEKFVNCGAVMFRVFLELSIDHYAGAESIPLTKPGRRPGSPDQDMTLREKIATVCNYLIQNGMTRHQLRGILNLQGNTNHILSVDTLHAYVHNKHYNPTAADLKSTWDNIEPFIQALWS